MAKAPDPITAPPNTSFQPYDATSEAPIGKWQSVDPNSGPASITTGEATGDFENGPGPWKQT